VSAVLRKTKPKSASPDWFSNIQNTSSSADPFWPRCLSICQERAASEAKQLSCRSQLAEEDIGREKCILAQNNLYSEEIFQIR